MTVADFIAEELVRRGVRHVFGVGGANIEDLFAAVQRRRPHLRAVLAKHEHGAGTAADAYARTGGGLGVVMTTSGGGAMNVVHAVAEAYASRVPMLAIIGEPPTDVQGKGAFQDTSGENGTIDARRVFQAISVFCERVENAARVPALLAAALDAARGVRPGPAVLLVAKDRQRAEVGDVRNVADVREAGEPRQAGRTAEALPTTRLPAGVPPQSGALRRAVAMLRRGPILLVAGDEVARSGAGAELGTLARTLQAFVAVAPDGRDAYDNRDPLFLGVAGAMGHAEVASRLAEARTVVLVGTGLPVLARQGLEGLLAEKVILSMGAVTPFICSPSEESHLHLGGELRDSLRSLVQALAEPGTPGLESSSGLSAEAAEAARASPLARTAGKTLPTPTSTSTSTSTLGAAASDGAFGSPAILALIERSVPDGSVIILDAGNTGAHAVHDLRSPTGGRWLMAMGMAGMGYSFGAAIGAALATGRRCTVLAGDGAFFMHGLEIHTAVEHVLPITYIIFNNRAHGMCLVRERLLLGQEAGYNSFRPSHIGAGLAAMFPGLSASDCDSLGGLTTRLTRAATITGPSVICAELPGVEIPPFVAFQRAITERASGGTPR